MLLSEAKQKISKFSPQFDLRSLSLLGNGMTSVAFLANEEWVFRFPSEALRNQRSLQIEIALLPHLSQFLSTKIPNFQYLAKDKGNFIYVGYKILPGIPLEKDTFYCLPKHKQEQALKDIALFIQSLHNFSAETAKKYEAREELYKGAYHSRQRDLLEQTQSLLTENEIAKIEESINSFEEIEASFSKPFTLLHADLKPEHILYDPKDGSITGIIDWGDVCIGDPDNDFTCLYLFYDRYFVISLLKYFPLENHERILAKIQFFITIRWLQDIALGLLDKDEQFVNFCLTKLRKHLQHGTY